MSYFDERAAALRGGSPRGPSVPKFGEPAPAPLGAPTSVNPYDLGRQFAQHFGGMPTHQIVQQMQAGQAPQSVAAPRESVSAAAPVTPQQAGAMNATQPGVFNGNPANGQKSEDEGFSKALAEGGPSPPPLPVVGGKQYAQPTSTGSRQTAAPVPPAPIPSPPTEGKQTAQADQYTDARTGDRPDAHASQYTAEEQARRAKAASAAAASKSPAYTAVPAEDGRQGAQAMSSMQMGGPAPPPLDLPATGNAAALAGSPEAGVMAKAASGPAPTPGVFDIGGVRYNRVQGAQIPPGFRTWDPVHQQRYINQHPEAFTPAFQAEADAGQILRQAGIGGGNDLPSTNPVPGGAATLYPGMTQPELQAAIGNDPVLYQIVSNVMQDWDQVHQPLPVGADNAMKATYDKMVADNAAREAALAKYGITFSPTKPITPPPGGPPSGPPGSPPPSGEDQPPAAPPPDDTVDIGGGTRPGDSQYPGTDLDVETAGSDLTFQDLVNRYVKIYGDQKGLAYAEAAWQAQQDANKDANRQKAIDLLGGAVQDFPKSPLYTGVQGIAADILKNPTPIPWDTVKNQYAANADRGAKASLEDITSAMTRRGLGVGSGAGLAADEMRKAAGERAMGLGQLDIQQATTDREMQEGAIRTGIGAMAGTSGVNIANIGNLSNMIRGEPTDYGNAYQGITGAFTNIDAIRAQIDAAQQAGQFSWGDAAQLLGQLGGAFLGNSGLFGSTPKTPTP